MKEMIETRRVESTSVWDEFVTKHNGHPLQLWGWGEVKAGHGWSVHRVHVSEQGSVIGGAQILVKPVPGPLKSFAYVARGPVVCDVSSLESVLEALNRYTKNEIGAVCLRIEPHATELDLPKGWKKIHSTILLAHTLIVDLNRGESDLLADIPSKRRYDIRKSTKAVKRFDVVPLGEVDDVLAIYKTTAQRAGFLLHDDSYYKDIATNLGDKSVIVGAYDESDNLVAFTWLVVTPEVAFELYSGITADGQRMRVNYGLKWYAICSMKARGVRQYDFNGLLNDGISDFKRSFAKDDTNLVGTYEYGLSVMYPVWAYGLPAVRAVLRFARNGFRR